MGDMKSGLKSAHIYTTQGDLSSLFSGTMSITTAPRGRKITFPTQQYSKSGDIHFAFTHCSSYDCLTSINAGLAV